MNYLLIGLVVFASCILAHGFVLLFNYFLKKKESSKQSSDRFSRNANDNIARRNFLLTEAFFELKENISLFENIYESIKDNSVNKVPQYLKKIESLKIIEASKTSSFSGTEFKMLDQLYSVIISRTKLEFNYELYRSGKINYLELRAKAREYLEQAQEVSKDFYNKYINLLN